MPSHAFSPQYFESMPSMLVVRRVNVRVRADIEGVMIASRSSPPTSGLMASISGRLICIDDTMST